MSRALRRDEGGLEVPVIRNDLYADACLSLLRGRGLIDSLTDEQLRAFGEMPQGPAQEVGIDRNT
ncbi:hypothetical protein ACQR1V_02690 [Bradyrhizobium oligotrophicum]|uniref:hypothetical protein n=1 Tax=Bradyrhizobium oligotrophicum TaxID=44255 RepID=UPI003EB81052